MNKRRLHHDLTELKPVKPWYFLAAGGASGVVAVLALQYNYRTMTDLRQTVYTADQQNGDVEGALRDLRSYVYNHMNTNLSSGSNAIYPPIQLKYRYERLVAQQAAGQSDNSQLYSDAQKYCETQNPTGFSGGNRVGCIENYVSAHGVQPSVAIPDSLYKFDFVSPRWSPDLAGWSLVVAILFIVAGLGLWLTKWWLKRATAH